ncbi:DNA-3-methyladenine glycosylase 2 family protein [Methylobacterium sp. C25]|uniref:DNA-3-methyladenine glycosylase family protein n=1 Tax=Methylobacterium sp. C25 TaxID=2721622 RepID=UPI001F2F94C2|nr:AlkA N-terminal domain-containing protein [Methylobacterium sp. C25]MCE4224623.1 DNA-3-methyladenine glycosylase 2 family protein [Methylobacterium sp. C25]
MSQDSSVTPVTLPYRAPYDWQALLDFLAARAIPGIERAGQGVYARTISIEGRHGTVTVRHAPEGEALRAELRFPEARQEPVIAARLRHLFDLDVDPAEIRARLASDADIAPLVRARPGLRVPGAWSGFELAMRGILGQQISVAAATRLAGKLVTAYGTPLMGEGETGLTHAFPAPEQLVEADVSLVLNMPRARGAAIRAVAAACIEEPDLFAVGQGLETAVARLKALRGIGDWTAHYIAMRALKEPDALPAGDIGLMRALDAGSGRPSPRQLLTRAEAWRPFRAYAAMHLWARDAQMETARLTAKANR